MSIMNKISVGDVDYYFTDDIPTFVAKKGSIALDGTNQLIYYNLDGSSGWARLLSKEYGSMYFFNNSTTRLGYVDTWYNLNNIGWSAGTMSQNFSLEEDGNGNKAQLTYNGERDIKALICGECTVESTIDWVELESGVAFNNIAPAEYQGGTVIGSENNVGMGNCRMDILKKNDYVNVGMRKTDDGGFDDDYAPKHYSVTLDKIDESRTFYENPWDEPTFSGNGWTIVNGSQPDKWIIGTSESTTGSRSAYVSTGETETSLAHYDISQASIVHFYDDFFFDDTKYIDITLSFDWKCFGDDIDGSSVDDYDYGTVVIADTGETPTAGTELYITPATNNDIEEPEGNGRIGAWSNDGKFNELYPPGRDGGDNKWRRESIKLNNYLGKTKRIIFTWKDDGDGTYGDQPPFVVDNIKLNFFI